MLSKSLVTITKIDSLEKLCKIYNLLEISPFHKMRSFTIVGILSDNAITKLFIITILHNHPTRYESMKVRSLRALTLSCACG